MRTAHLSPIAGAWLALALAVAEPRAGAQDTTATPRNVLSPDLSRVQSFVTGYDMIVHVGDSAHVIGQREVAFSASFYAGQPAWLLIETRTGIVPSLDSLFLGLDMRPLHYSSELGRSRLGAEFSGDSIFGATVTPTSRRSLILGSRPDLLVSTAMIEVLLGLMPLALEWSDSAAVLAVDAGEAVVLPAELAVTGESLAPGDSTASAWVVAVRTERGQMQLWMEKSNGRVSRIEQQLPAHVGSSLEYRRRPPLAVPPP